MDSAHELLPRCDAVVTHGGYGTVTAALSHGCPFVLLPISADQPMNAAGCAASGVGITVEPRDRTPSAIRAATTAVLEDPRYRRAAQQSARELRDRPGIELALDLLERLVGTREQSLRSEGRDCPKGGPPTAERVYLAN